MKTLLIYINRSGNMSDLCRYFLAYEEEKGDICILEYARKEGHRWTDERYYEIYKRAVERVSGYAEWKLLVVDDRRKTVEKDRLYGDDWFLWRLIDLFEEGRKHSSIAPPTSISVITSVDVDYECEPGVEKEEACCEYIKKWKSGVLPRLFFYNFRGNGKELPEKQEILFYLILLYFSWGDVSPEYYSVSVIYKVNSMWDWNAFHQYAGQMMWQYEKKESEIEKTMRYNSLPRPLHFTIEPASRELMSHKSKKNRIDMKKLKKEESELHNVHRRILERAKYEFEEIRSIYSGTRYNWDPDMTMEDIKRKRETYEKQLDDMYEKGIWDFKKISEQIEGMREKLKKKTDRRSVWYQIFSVAELTLGLIIFLKRSTGMYIIAPVGVAAVFLLSYDLKNSRRYGIAQDDWTGVRDDIDRGERRIKEEISCMANYMKMWQQYYAMVKEEKNSKESIRTAMRERDKLLRCRKAFNLILEIDRRNYPEKEKIVPDTEGYKEAEALYYPAGWNTGESLETPQRERESFPFPFITSIQIDKLERRKTKEA